MDKNEFSNLEKQIMSTVTSAVKAIDFANLKKDINIKTEDSLNQFISKFNEYSTKFMNSNKKSKNDIRKYIAKNPKGSMSGVVCIMFGAIGSSMFGISTLVFLMINSFFENGVLFGQPILGVLLLFLVASIGLLSKGIISKNRVRRFNQYVRIMDGHSYFSIDELAKFSKKKYSFVLKELRKMINMEMFLEGHIDDENTYFMINDEVYSDYLNMKKQQLNNVIDEEEVIKIVESEEKEKVNSTIKMGRDYIEQMNNIKNQLYKENIAKDIDKLVDISGQILYQVEKNPQKIQEVNKFINHYLPITIKLISSYEEMNRQVTKSENIENAKIEIEKSIHLINSAFENLLDDLFEDVAMDISTDISVLKTLFKQEGLTDEDFKK